MALTTLIILLFATLEATVNCNSEGDALNSLRESLTDPNNVLQSWDSTLPNPCTWFHVTCNNDNSVVRVDLGEAGLAGSLTPTLGLLTNLQYLEMGHNNISGTIPFMLGNLTNLISLGLHQNRLSGVIPSSLGNLRSLKFMRLDGNYLTGQLPTEVLQLVRLRNLSMMNISNNMLAGTIGRSKANGFSTTTIVQDLNALN